MLNFLRRHRYISFTFGLLITLSGTLAGADFADASGGSPQTFIHARRETREEPHNDHRIVVTIYRLNTTTPEADCIAGEWVGKEVPQGDAELTTFLASLTNLEFHPLNETHCRELNYTRWLDNNPTHDDPKIIKSDAAQFLKLLQAKQVAEHSDATQAVLDGADLADAEWQRTKLLNSINYLQERVDEIKEQYPLVYEKVLKQRFAPYDTPAAKLLPLRQAFLTERDSATDTAKKLSIYRAHIAELKKAFPTSLKRAVRNVPTGYLFQIKQKLTDEASLQNHLMKEAQSKKADDEGLIKQRFDLLREARDEFRYQEARFAETLTQESDPDAKSLLKEALAAYKTDEVLAKIGELEQWCDKSKEDEALAACQQIKLVREQERAEKINRELGEANDKIDRAHKQEAAERKKEMQERQKAYEEKREKSDRELRKFLITAAVAATVLTGVIVWIDRYVAKKRKEKAAAEAALAAQTEQSESAQQTVLPQAQS